MALERAEIIIAKFYGSLNEIELICNEPHMSDAEKIARIGVVLENARRDVAKT